MNRLIAHIEEDLKMDSDFVKAMTIILAVFSANSYMGLWLKRYIDEVKAEQRTTEKALLKDYMDKDDTIKMYAVMSQVHEQKLDDLKHRFERMDEKLDQLLERK